MTIRRSPLLFLLAFVATAHAATMEPAPGTVSTAEKQIVDAWIESETTDGVVFYLGDWKSPNRLATTRKPGAYNKVLYTGNNDVTFMKAEVQYANGEWEKAADSYKKASATAKWNWEAEQAYRRAAECLARLNKGAEALAVQKEYLARYPKNVHMAEVVSLRARLALGAGDFPGAMGDYKLMTEQGAKWSPTAELDGFLGQRQVLIAQKKPADAIALLNPYLAKLKPDADPDAYAQVALAIATDLDAEGKVPECIAMLKKTYLAPLAPEAQARARLHHARLLSKTNDTESNLAAFDQVAIAALLGGDPETEAGATKLARELANRIDKDTKLSDVVRKEYRSYLASL